MNNNVPISFQYGQKLYSGTFHIVCGTGHEYVWHLYLNSFYYGNLQYTDRWVFSGSDFQCLADFFGDYLTAWYQ
jgi:hypothetical protein